MIGKPYRSYVAIGDSLSEGLGDFTFEQDRHHNGWTDRLAAILAKEAQVKGYEFHFANLALRGSKLEKIMEGQLQAALRLQPDLVTVMAGSNDLMARVELLPKLRETLRDGIQQLVAAGCDVLVANTINPLHLKVLKPLRGKADMFSTLIETVADEYELPLLDVHGQKHFENLVYWAKDMVHFSGYGHIEIANRAAEILGLDYRYQSIDADQLPEVSRGAVETLKWLAQDVIPFFQRRLKGRTSGDGMDAKHTELVPYRANLIVPELVSA